MQFVFSRPRFVSVILVFIHFNPEQILDESGIVLVPGSGFGQEEGTLHFRTTFLPAEASMPDTLKRLAKAHKNFMDEHRDWSVCLMRINIPHAVFSLFMVESKF